MILVFLDACVLVPIGLTNVILTASEHDLLQPYWSPTVVDEAVRQRAAQMEADPTLGALWEDVYAELLADIQ